MTIVAVLVGALVGAVVALLHQRASWRASQALVHAQRPRAVLLGLPLRVGVPAAVFVGLARWSHPAMIAGLVAFGLVAVIAGRRRVTREDA